ncbi:MAG: GntR family transcriptional regulator [Phycisphaerae bacterium]
MPLDPKAKYRQIYHRFHKAIVAGEYQVGQQIPTETQLARDYQTSRPTVAKALRDLEQAGYLRRQRGVGTFVADRRETAGKLIGLILPRPGEGIFAPMCDAIIREAEANGYGLLLAGSLMAGRDVAIPREEAFCEQLVSRRVAGVLFGPLDVTPGRMIINGQITERLDRAGIPIVLLDRDICDYPSRSKFDLVGINNRRESAVLTEHLLRLGCRRIEFIRDEWSVSTASARIDGYKDAMASAGIQVDPQWIHRWAPDDQDFVRNLIHPLRAEAFVCVNDRIAAALMHSLAVFGIKVPDDVRLVGFDDIEVATRLPVPLTTVRQPAGCIGQVAAKMLLERMENPSLPPREMVLSCELVVRNSCGSRLQRSAAAG